MWWIYTRNIIIIIIIIIIIVVVVVLCGIMGLSSINSVRPDCFRTFFVWK